MSETKRFEFAVGVDETGVLFSEGRAALDLPTGWTPEHLLLGALARCSLSSLRYHARRAGARAHGRATASGAVARRTSDSRFAFVEEHIALDVAIDPPPDHDALVKLLTKAERDCYVGASLTAAPGFAWRVNGREVETASPADLIAARPPDA